MPKRVLVVEDDREVRETIVDILQDRGYDVTSAADGLEALKQLRDSDAWSVVLLDLMMPNMDGREFRAHQLRDPALAAIPVVIMSALEDVATAARDLAAAGHVPKPVSLKRLVETVERFADD